MPPICGLDGGSLRSKPATDLPAAVLEDLEALIGALDRQIVGSIPQNGLVTFSNNIDVCALALGLARVELGMRAELPQKAGKESMGWTPQDNSRKRAGLSKPARQTP